MAWDAGILPAACRYRKSCVQYLRQGLRQQRCRSRNDDASCAAPAAALGAWRNDYARRVKNPSNTSLFALNQRIPPSACTHGVPLPQLTWLPRPAAGTSASSILAQVCANRPSVSRERVLSSGGLGRFIKNWIQKSHSSGARTMRDNIVLDKFVQNKFVQCIMAKIIITSILRTRSIFEDIF